MWMRNDIVGNIADGGRWIDGAALRALLLGDDKIGSKPLPPQTNTLTTRTHIKRVHDGIWNGVFYLILLFRF